jgi:hypothetical protein
MIIIMQRRVATLCIGDSGATVIAVERIVR